MKSTSRKMGIWFGSSSAPKGHRCWRGFFAIPCLALLWLATSLPAHAPQGEIPPVVQELATLLGLVQEGKVSEALTRMQAREEIRRTATQLDRTMNLHLEKALAARQRDRNVVALRRDLRTLGFYLILQPLRQIERDLTQGQETRNPLQAILQQGRNVFILLFEAYLKEQDPPLHSQLELALDLMERRVAEGDRAGFSRLLKEFVEALTDAYNIPPPR